MTEKKTQKNLRSESEREKDYFLASDRKYRGQVRYNVITDFERLFVVLSFFSRQSDFVNGDSGFLASYSSTKSTINFKFLRSYTKITRIIQLQLSRRRVVVAPVIFFYLQFFFSYFVFFTIDTAVTLYAQHRVRSSCKKRVLENNTIVKFYDNGIAATLELIITK